MEIGKKISNLCCILLAMAALAAIAIKYSEPINDGDIWFHLAYGRYFFENNTLIPDHSVFSWTPAENNAVYCTWIPDVIFYGLYKAGGISFIYPLRYLAIFILLLLVATYPIRHRKAFIPAIVLICFTGLLMSYAGLRIKPELFSFLLMSIMVWVWLRLKLKPDKALPFIYAFPLISLIWVNSHGGFIFGMVFLILIVAGEVLNWVTGSADRLSNRVLQHMLISALLSFSTIFLNPYGWHYPKYLIDTLFLHPEEFNRHMETIAEYQSIFFPQASCLHFKDYLLVAAIFLVILFAERIWRRNVDWALLLVNICFMFIYMKFLRTTYYWGIIFVFTSLHLLGDLPSDIFEGSLKRSIRLVVYGVCALIISAFAARAGYETMCIPSTGFNPSYISPTVEAEYIRTNFSGLLVGNDYYCGSYFMWSLWPEQKVFIDARYFPYRKWYQEYSEFESSADIRQRESFVRKYKCHVWSISHDVPLLKYFLTSPDWRLVYYGPSACIFLAREIDYSQNKHSVSREIYRAGFFQTYEIAKFAASIGDIDIAQALVNRMKPAQLCPIQVNLAINARLNVGNYLIARRRFADAIHMYTDALTIEKTKKPLLPLWGNSNTLELALLHDKLGYSFMNLNQINNAISEYNRALQMNPTAAHAIKYLPKLMNQIRKIDESITRLQSLLRSQPDKPEVLHSLALCYSMKGQYDTALGYLLKEMRINPDSAEIYYNVACIYSRQMKMKESIYSQVPEVL